LALYLLVADGEPRAQIYGAAADREQAGIVFTEAANMVQASEELSERLEVVRSTKRLVDPTTASFYHAISADAYTNEGLNAHGIIFDELHAQKTRDLWDALRYATASRRQPLSIAITTAGYDRESICYEQHQYAQRVLDGSVHDHGLLAYIAAAPQDADWQDPKIWKAANPSYGVTLDPEQMADDCREAIASPRKESAFRRYRLNQWVGHAENWISPADWAKGAEPFEAALLEGEECYVGIDLARKRDLAAVVLLFPRDEEFVLLPRFFLPKECLEERERQDHVSYSAWAKAGLLTLTDGEVIDYRFIREQVKRDAERYKFIEIGYDPWNAELLCNQQLGQEDGFAVVEVRPVIGLLGPAASEFEKLVREGRIRHGGNPVLAWMIAGCAVREDHNQNILPSKRNSTSRIDGVMAAITALSRAQTTERISRFYEANQLEVW
jgi:phage terminase large subunit-like protein